MKDGNERSPRKTNAMFAVFTVQTALVLLILTSIMVIKYFLPDEFEEIKRFYERTFEVETSVEEVLGTGEENEI